MKHTENKIVTRAKESLTLNASTEVRSMVDGRPTQIEALINTRAYGFFLARGSEPGFALDDWLCAEAEVMRQRIKQLPV
jgi:hypothetical protein